MDPFLKAVSSDWWHISLAVIVGGLFVSFLWLVLIRGLGLWASLRGMHKKLGQTDRNPAGQLKSRLRAIFTGTLLEPHWSEYEDTLHDQRDESGIERTVSAVRATVPAESFFNADLIVDGRLHTEFFKHLPGILTGIGIIATFSGLIAGLQAFDPNAIEPEALKGSLKGLFGHVQSAFMLSAVAIGLAMVCTMLEKALYAASLHQVTEIAAELDGMFRAGVGEEYLSQLVQSSEDGAVQTRQLKESLVEDLKSLLTNLTERQIQATQQMSADIGSTLQSSLQEPLQRIADTVNIASRDQSEHAGRMIENLMTAFMAQMRDTMGGQMGELSGMMRQSAEAVSRVEVSLRALVEDMRQASRTSSEGIQSAMGDLLSSLAQHQSQQSEAVGNSQASMLAQVQQAIDRMVSAQEASSSHVNDAAVQATDRISVAMAESQRASSAAAERASELVEGMQTTALDAISQLEHGAERIATMLATLDGTVDQLARSAYSLEGLHQRAAQIGTQIESAANGLRSSSEALTSSVVALSQASVRIEGMSSLMASEAGARESSLKQIDLALSHSKDAAKEFAAFSEQVATELETAIGTFGDGTVAVLNNNLTNFDKELSNAVSTLHSLVERMTLAAADVADRRGA
jgi:putative membrane protein